MGRSKKLPVVGQLIERRNNCVGCGYCCSKVVCIIGYQKFGGHPPCPALREHDGRFWCGLVEDAKGMEKEDLIAELAIGAGCSSSMLNTVRDSQIAKMEKKDEKSYDSKGMEEDNKR